MQGRVGLKRDLPLNRADRAIWRAANHPEKGIVALAFDAGKDGFKLGIRYGIDVE